MLNETELKVSQISPWSCDLFTLHQLTVSYFLQLMVFFSPLNFIVFVTMCCFIIVLYYYFKNMPTSKHVLNFVYLDEIMSTKKFQKHHYDGLYGIHISKSHESFKGVKQLNILKARDQGQQPLSQGE